MKPLTMRPLTTARLILALAPTLLAGCGGGGGGSSSSPSPAPAAPLSVSAATPSGLTATLAEDRSAISTGGNVNYILTLTNNTSQPITFQTFGNGGNSINGSMRVVDASNTVVYPGPISSQVASVPSGNLTLAPGQALTETFSLGNIFTTVGSYKANAAIDFYTASTGAIQSILVGPLTVTVQ